MNEVDPTVLPLRDIHLPAAVSWWPLAPGWWLLLATLGAAVVAVAGWRWWRRRARPWRAALVELMAIEQAFAATGDGHACAQALSRLLRRLGLLTPDIAAATARDAAWHTLLATLGGRPLPAPVQAVIALAPYSPAAAAALTPAAYRAALAALRDWLARVHPPRASARPAAATNAAV